MQKYYQYGLSDRIIYNDTQTLNERVKLNSVREDMLTAMINAFCGARRPLMRFRAAALQGKTAARLM